MSKNFVVVKLNVLFTYLFTDHTLEQEVKMLKRHKLDGWSKDGAALITTTPHIACIHVVQQYLNIFPQASKSSERCEYYLFYKKCVVRSRASVLKLRLRIVHLL